VNALEQIIEHSRPGPFMLRRLAQLALAGDRGISNAALAKKLDLSREALNQYFTGRLWITDDESAREHEDDVERAIEDISREKGFTLPRVTVVTGPPDADGIPEVAFPQAPIPEAITRELMKEPHR
jgi:hypothetical protein